MEEVYGCEYVSLHVRVSNKAAFHLYTNTLGYKCVPSCWLPGNAVACIFTSRTFC